jgi:hypothetical protein
VREREREGEGEGRWKAINLGEMSKTRGGGKEGGKRETRHRKTTPFFECP